MFFFKFLVNTKIMNVILNHVLYIYNFVCWIKIFSNCSYVAKPFQILNVFLSVLNGVDVRHRWLILQKPVLTEVILFKYKNVHWKCYFVSLFYFRKDSSCKNDLQLVQHSRFKHFISTDPSRHKRWCNCFLIFFFWKYSWLSNDIFGFSGKIFNIFTNIWGIFIWIFRVKLIF